MNEQLQQLKELTTLDATILQLREQVARYPAMEARLDAAEAAILKTIPESESGVETALRERRQAEKEIAALEGQIKKYMDQQAAVKTNKEYQAITAEIDNIRKKIDDFETVALEKLEAEGELQRRKKEAGAQLEKLKTENNVERQRIQGQKAEKTERITKLESERARRLAGLDEELRETYELLNQKFPGSAVAPLEGETCGGCHWTLVASTRQHVRGGKDLVRCEHCHRWLFQPGQ